MKSVAVVAGFAAGLVAAHNHGHQHAHHNVRRGDDGVVTAWSMTTEWTYVTVTAGDDNTPAVSAASSAGSSSAVANDVQAEAVATPAADPNSPEAIQASAIAAVNSLNAQQNAINSAHAADPSAPISSIGAQAAAPAQSTAAQPAQQPAASSSAAAAPASSGSTTGSSTTSSMTNTNCWTTHMTYYDPAGGYGSCGWTLESGNNTVALGEQHMNGAACDNMKIQFTIDGTDGTVHEGYVADKCAACASDDHVDVNQGWAFEIYPNIQMEGLHGITVCLP